MTKRILHEERGFTLIELLVVILIIGILAAIALPAFLGQRSKGQDADAKSAARNLVSAVESFYATNQTYVNANGDNDIKQSGVWTSASEAGKAKVTNSTSDSYTIVGYSASGNSFTITKSGATVNRTCATTGSGACPAGGTW